MAISAFYHGKAIVELIDVDRLFSDSVAKVDKVQDFDLLKESGAKFRESRRQFDAAARACAQVAALAPGDEKLLLDLDIKTFQTVADGAADLAKQMDQGILPPNRPVHQLTALIRDQDVLAERRAVAYQGLRGHLPKGY